MEQKSRNPYYNNASIDDPALFFNRIDDINKLLNSLFSDRPQCISIVGQRKIGKSSLVRQLAKIDTARRFGFSYDNVRFIFFDCQRFLFSLTSASHLYGEMLKQVHAGIPEEFVDVVLSKEISENSGREFEVVLQALSKKGILIVFIFDEFEKAIAQECLIKEGFFGSLRGYTQSNSNFAWITCTSRYLHELFEDSFDEFEVSEVQRRSESDFFNIAPVHVVSLFNSLDIMSLINEPANNYGVSFPKEIVDIILKLGGSFPYFIQRSCYHFFDKENENKTENGKIIFESCRREFVGLWNNYWDKLKPNQQEILLSIANTSYGGNDNFETESLIDSSLIYKDYNNILHPFSEAFRDFIKSKDGALSPDSKSKQKDRLLKEREEELKQERQKLSDTSAVVVKSNQELNSAKEEIDNKNSEISILTNRITHLELYTRLLLGAHSIVLGFVFLFLFPQVLNWSWLLAHPKKINIYASALLLIVGIAWVIIDRHPVRRLIAAVPLVIGVILGLLQII